MFRDRAALAGLAGGSVQAGPLVLACMLPACGPRPEPAADPLLVTYIDSLRAIDDHAHPMLPILEGEAADTDLDALPLDGIPAFPIPWRLTLENPEWGIVARSLYGVSVGDTSEQVLAMARRGAAKTQGVGFAVWALDAIGTDVMLANRIAMGDGLESPRFRWVAFVDPLLFPLDTRAEAERTPDVRALYPKESVLLRRYLKDLGLSGPPSTLAGWVSDVVPATLRRERDLGAVAVKFEAAYLLFGSDAFDGGATRGWAEVAAFSTRSARRALALTLTGMMRDGDISRQRAETVARMVLRENAQHVYGIQSN